MKKGLKKLLLFLFKYSPYIIKREVIRRNIDINIEKISNIEVKLAQTKSELEQAFALVQESYKKANISSNDNDIRITKHHAYPSTNVIILKYKDEIVATVSIITNDYGKLPVEETWNISLPQEKKLAEISSLAVKKEYQRQMGKFTVPLMLFLYNYSYKYIGIEHFYIATHPRAESFYMALFNFKRFSKEIKYYKEANNAPAVGLHLDLNEWTKEKKLKDKFREKLHKVLHSPINYFLYPEEKYYFPSGLILTPEVFDFFFKDKTSIFDKLPTTDKERLKEIYSYNQYLDDMMLDNHLKYYLLCRAEFLDSKQQIIQGKINYITKNSICGNIKDFNDKSSNIILCKIDISRYETLVIEGSFEVKNNTFTIKNFHCDNWDSFFNFIQSKYHKPLESQYKKIA